jgi:hypothetical protein
MQANAVLYLSNIVILLANRFRLMWANQPKAALAFHYPSVAEGTPPPWSVSL